MLDIAGFAKLERLRFRPFALGSCADLGTRGRRACVLCDVLERAAQARKHYQRRPGSNECQHDDKGFPAARLQQRPDHIDKEKPADHVGNDRGTSFLKFFGNRAIDRFGIFH